MPCAVREAAQARRVDVASRSKSLYLYYALVVSFVLMLILFRVGVFA